VRFPVVCRSDRSDSERADACGSRDWRRGNQENSCDRSDFGRGLQAAPVFHMYCLLWGRRVPLAATSRPVGVAFTAKLR
jgi:hypothetical protein